MFQSVLLVFTMWAKSGIYSNMLIVEISRNKVIGATMLGVIVMDGRNKTSYLWN